MQRHATACDGFTCSLLSTPVTHHCCSTSVTSSVTAAIASSVTADGATRPSCASARLPHSDPVTVPMVSRPPKFFFSRAFGLSCSGSLDELPDVGRDGAGRDGVG